MKRMFLGLLFFRLLLPVAAAPAAPAPADTACLRQHLLFLTTTPQPRNYQHPAVLDSVAAYIKQQLWAAGAHEIAEQLYAVRGQTYRNVLGSFGSTAGSRLIIGAHYDVCGD